MTKKLSTAVAAARLASLAACGASPTGSEAAAPGDWQASTAPADTSTGRVPNLFGSGN